ncbi:MAG: hypothetical protein HDT32_06780 [Clostridiales bacterium]|nr:hypothetical protein [Clostridiales bacterium]
MFGRRHRSYYTKEGYKQVYKPRSLEARSNGYVAEHRDVASRKIGRPLRPNEVVHHRDGNKRNNRPSNLQVMSRARHWKIHHSK